nr:hypothetical protein [Candidatus Woesebacteria bacterium]
DKLRILDAILLGRNVFRGDERLKSLFLSNLVRNDSDLVRSFLDARVPLAKAKPAFYLDRIRNSRYNEYT